MMAKFLSTLRIAATLVLARSFGTYECSVWNGEFNYARYRWRGQSWAIPIGSIEEGE